VTGLQCRQQRRFVDQPAAGMLIRIAPRRSLPRSTRPRVSAVSGT
jgi:hypothetical protein